MENREQTRRKIEMNFNLHIDLVGINYNLKF